MACTTARAQKVENNLQCLLLHVATRLEVKSEAIELVFTITRADAQYHATAAQDIDETGILNGADRICERKRYDRHTELDALGESCKISSVHPHIRHDAVLGGEVMLRQPRAIKAEAIGGHDLFGDALVHVAVRIGFAVLMGLRGEEDAEFHCARSWGQAPTIAGCWRE